MNFLDPLPYLEEAIQSVVSQTYPHWELLLVDDGSSDGASEVAKSYAAQFPERVRYLEHEGHQNRGMSASRNLGIRHARGEYVTLLDADDAWLPDFLEWQVQALAEQPRAAMVYGPLLYWHSWSGQAVDAERDVLRHPWLKPGTLVQPPHLLPIILEKTNGTPSGFLIRRDIVLAVGEFQESFRDLFEDQVFCAKVALTAPIYVSGKWGYKYRQHAESACGRTRNTAYQLQARERFLRWLSGYLREHGRYHPVIWKSLCKEFVLLFLRQHVPLYGSLDKAMKKMGKRIRGVTRRVLSMRAA
jgi:glycosyltransferase involved in cell wall biosynthesis